jgi:hypothetical protein
MSAAVDRDYLSAVGASDAEAVLPRKKDAPPPLVLAAAKVEQSVSDRLDKLMRRIKRKTGLRITRSDVVRLAIERGLPDLEAEHPPEPDEG